MGYDRQSLFGKIFLMNTIDTESKAHQLGAQSLQSILIVEDNPIFLQTLIDSIDRLGLKDRVLPFLNGSDALSKIEAPATQIDLALIDLGLPDINGIALIRAMRRFFPKSPVMVISVITSEEMVVAAIRAGVHGYITKSQPEVSITKAIEDVLKGHYPISPSLARTLFRLAGSPKDVSQNLFDLSAREIETLKLLSHGFSYAEVGIHMGVAVSTVQSNIRSLYRKLEVHSQVQAINKAKDAGVI
jgi:two-component system, NarL family, nitrate/nitrite response regulator NarL